MANPGRFYPSYLRENLVGPELRPTTGIVSPTHAEILLYNEVTDLGLYSVAFVEILKVKTNRILTNVFESTHSFKERQFR